jgi:uncharacterized protein
MNILDFLTNGQASQLGTNGDGAQRLVANLMMQRSEWMKSLLDSSRNIDGDCGYPTGYIDPKIYWELYQREPIASRVCEVYPKESWQVQPTIFELEDASTKTQFEEAWDALGKQLRGEQSFYQEEEASVVFDFLCDADIKCGIGHYAAILLGFDDGAPLDQPIDLIDAGKPAKASAPSNGASRRLLFMQVYPETAVQINSLEADMQSPRYGLPTEYDISMMDPLEFSSLGAGTSLPSNRASVHWTRVVHISEYGVLHTPRQRPVLNRLLDLRKLYGGSAEMYWRGAFPGYAIKTQPQLGADVDINREDVKQQLTDYSNALQRFLVLMGMDITALAPQVSDPSSQIDKQVEAICIQLGIPKRIFMGSERGELASTQDDQAWNDRLKQRQLGVITPRIIIPFVDRLIATRVLPRPAKGYRVSWPDLTSKSDEEKAGIATQRTQAISVYVAGQLETTLAPMDFWTRIMGFTEDEAQSIIDNAEEVKAQKEKEQAAKDAEAAKVQAEAQAKMDAAAKTAADATGTEQTATAPGSPTSPGKPFGGKGSQSPTSAPPNASTGQPGGSNAGGGSLSPVAHAFDPSQPLDSLDTNAKAALSGGRWVTIEGRHVYLKGGKIVAGPPDLKGETLQGAQAKASSHDSAAATTSKESAPKTESKPAPKPEAKKSGPAAAVTATHLKSMEPDLNSVKDEARRERIGKAIKGYYDGDFTEMNTALREGRADKSRLKDTISDFRSAFHEVGHELQKDVTVYRVVKKMPFNVSSLGAEFHDKGFVSTTADKSVANGLGSGGDTSERRIFSIRVPKGMKVIAGMGGRDTSKEVTLPDGVRFRVVSVGKKTLLGQHIGLEVLHDR